MPRLVLNYMWKLTSKASNKTKSVPKIFNTNQLKMYTSCSLVILLALTSGTAHLNVDYRNK